MMSVEFGGFLLKGKAFVVARALSESGAEPCVKLGIKPVFVWVLVDVRGANCRGALRSSGREPVWRALRTIHDWDLPTD